MVVNKTIILAIVVLVVLIIPFSIIHEFSHALVCHLEGHSYEVKVGIYVPSSMICVGNVTNIDAFRAAGGVIAATIAGITGIIVKPKFLKIALYSISIGHLLNAVIETLFYQTYIDENLWQLIFGLADAVIFIGITFLMIKKSTLKIS